jgi:hypothetical protein
MKPFFLQDFSEVVNVKTVAQACSVSNRLDWCDASVAIVVSGRGAIENPHGTNRAFSKSK